MPPHLNQTVVALGFVSLFADVSSEMSYTQIPRFLTTVLGAPAWTVGLIEGIAESTASLLKVVAGSFSDRMGRRKPLTILGYSLGMIPKPLLALAFHWPMVLFLRFLDRMGKGVRTAPRDALIAETTPKELRGRAFGLHRTMDTTGAVLGPLLGAWFLTHVSGDLRNLFLFSGIPGLIAVLVLLFLVREPAAPKSASLPADNASPAPDFRALPFLSPRVLWRGLDPHYRRFLLVVMLFSLGNSSDAFLILRATKMGLPAQEILYLYASFNVIEVLFGYAAGRLSDRVGRRPLIIAGYGVFTLVYAGFALATTRTHIWILFLMYGGYYALTQGVQRAFAADMADPKQRATQVGAYHTILGVMALPASLLAGRLMDWNVAAPFAVGALTAGLAALLLLLENLASRPPSHEPSA